MDKRIPAATIRRVWQDGSISSAEAAASVGLSRVNLWQRAKKLGLPPRKSGRLFKVDEGQFRKLWSAHVSIAEMAAYLGCATCSIPQIRRRLGLPKRRMGKHPTITMAQFWELQLGLAMQRQAKVDAVLAMQRMEALAS